MIVPRQNRETLPDRQAGEQGYLLLGLLFLFALILIGLAVAAPRIARQIQRQKELETIHRGEQYKRAIQLYYRKFGAYPTSIAQLKETDQIRFLRQEYVDPMTGKKDWKLLHLGQVQMVTMGFFGQTMQGAGAVPGTATQGVGGTGMTNGAAGGMAGGIGGGSSIESSNGIGGGSGFGSSTSMTGGGLNSSSTSDDGFFNDSSSSGTNSNGVTANGNSSSASSENSTSGSANAQDQQSSTDDSFDNGNSGFGSGGLSSGGMNSSGTFGSSSSTGNSVGSGSFGSNASPSIPGLPGSTAAGMNGAGGASGGPIVGVTVPLKKASMIVYRKQKVYDKWQFVYNPREEIAAALGQATSQTSGTGLGTPAGTSSTGQSGTSSGNSFGSSSNSFGSSSNSFGSSSSGFGSTSNGSGSSPSNSSGFGSTGLGSSQNQSNQF